MATVITQQIARAAVDGNADARCEVLSAVWGGEFKFDENSPWGRDLKELSSMAPYSTAKSSVTVESLVCWLAWMSFAHPNPPARRW